VAAGADVAMTAKEMAKKCAGQREHQTKDKTGNIDCNHNDLADLLCELEHCPYRHASRNGLLIFFALLMAISNNIAPECAVIILNKNWRRRKSTTDGHGL